MQVSDRISQFRESVIRDMTRLAIKHEAINLSQGFPDFDALPEIREAAVRAIQEGLNQYAITWGLPLLRRILAEQYTARLGWDVDSEEHVTVTCGVTEGIVAAMMAVLNPGDEIIIIEPAHDNFRPSARMVNAIPVPVPLDEPGFRLDGGRLAAAITPRTRAVLLNTPHNPTGRVFDEAELALVEQIVVENNLVLITDEIYDRILYDGRRHQSPGGRQPLRERTITIGGLGKTFALTGWRLGYVVAPTALARAVRPVHDYLTICAPTPLQAGAVAALGAPATFYEQLTADFHERREVMMGILDEIGFVAGPPEGAYYVMADYSQLPIPQAAWSPQTFSVWMTAEVGVAVVPGDSFYSLPEYGRQTIRFAFPKRLTTLQAAGERMREKMG